MKIAAIICEYNPFHRGHAYQIAEIRRRLPSDVRILSILSGSLTERGDTAIYDKYTRAEMALTCGADIVVELAAPWSFSGAEFFALGGVGIAARLGADYLCFGSECGDVEKLKTVSFRLTSPEYLSVLASEREKFPNLQEGRLRADVYRRLYGDTAVFSGSNDLLALAYLHAIDRMKSLLPHAKPIEPVAIRRIGEAYNAVSSDADSTLPQKSDAAVSDAAASDAAVSDAAVSDAAVSDAAVSDATVSDAAVSDAADGLYLSAGSIRTRLYAGEPAVGLLPDVCVPLAEKAAVHRLQNLDSVITAYLRFCPDACRGAVESAGGIENRIREAARSESTIDGIVGRAAGRRYSASRIRRILFGGILGFSIADCEVLPEYCTLLAANAAGRDVAACHRKDSFLLTKPSDCTSLSDRAKRQYEANLRAESLWSLSADDVSERRCDILMKKKPVIYP